MSVRTFAQAVRVEGWNECLDEHTNLALSYVHSIFSSAVRIMCSLVGLKGLEAILISAA